MQNVNKNYPVLIPLVDRKKSGPFMNFDELKQLKSRASSHGYSLRRYVSMILKDHIKSA